MKKLSSNHGMTLMEVLVAIMILVLLVVGIGTGMNSGLQVFRAVSFETSSAALADNMDTMLGDLLRHSVLVTKQSDPEARVVFTNTAFGAEDSYLYLNSGGRLAMNSVRKTPKEVELLNKGLYEDLKLDSFSISYETQSENTACFKIEYTIISTTDSSKERTAKTVIRHLNP